MVKVRKLWLWITSGFILITALGGFYIHSETQKQRAVATVVATLDLEEAIGKYYSEYNLPPDTGAIDFTMDSPAGQRLLASLTGDERPGQISFLTPRGKLRHSSEEFINRATTDPWGSPYRVILDNNSDQRITIKLSQGETEISGVHALVLSRGRDGIEGTSDDIQSWKFKR